MTKLFIFDLDGVLVDSCDAHWDAFRTALREVAGVELTKEEHDRSFNGLSTRAKLEKLNVPDSQRESVFRRKQELTQISFLDRCIPSERLIRMLEGLRADGSKLACASNCVRNTVHAALEGLGIYGLFDLVLSNEDVGHPKPSPEIYETIMRRLNVPKQETLIFEDSYVGLLAACGSGASVHRVSNAADLSLEYALSAKPNLTRHVNVVIPMAGNGSRFAQVGYTDPKPFIPVLGSPMISWVVRNIGIDANYTFIIRKEFETSYNARGYLDSLAPGCNVVAVDKVTEGAACTVLLSKDHIDNDNPLIIINSDQYIEFGGDNTAFKFVFDFLYNPAEVHWDAKISTFDGQRHPKWSYAKLGDDGLVVEVREKDPFSDHATTGLYMWRRGSDFVRYAHQMIAKNIRVNNEFYVVPVFGEALADGKRIGICDCERMWGIGTPEDLDVFVKSFQG